MFSSISKSLTLFLTYCAWLVFFRVAGISVITYVAKSPQTRLQDLSEYVSSAEFPFAAFGVLTFIGLWASFRPGVTQVLSKFWQLSIFRTELKPFFTGGLWVVGLVLALIWNDSMEFLGFTVSIDSPIDTMMPWVGRSLLLFAWVVGEYFLFQGQIEHGIKAKIGLLPAAIINGILATWSKTILFDPGWLQSLGWFILSLRQSYRGYGFTLGVLITHQVLFGLPLLGNEFAGILMVRSHPVSDDPILRFLTGGSSGLLSSLLFQGILLAQLVIQLGMELTKSQLKVKLDQR